MAPFSKDDERQHLRHFLEARQSATGEELTYVRDSEAPDFICKRPDGTEVGIEHTKVAYNPELYESAGDTDECIDEWEVIWSAYNAVIKKEAKRAKAGWIPTILVLDFVDGNALEWFNEEEDLSSDFADSGFLEIWLIDHSTIETHDAVRAIGLYPPNNRGVQGQGYLYRAPYK